MYYKPYESKLDHYTQVIVEILICIYFILLNFYLADRSSEIIEWILISIMLTSVILLAIVNTSKSVLGLINRCRQRRRSRKVFATREIDIENGSSTISVSKVSYNDSVIHEDKAEIEDIPIQPSYTWFYKSLSKRTNKQ